MDWGRGPSLLYLQIPIFGMAVLSGWRFVLLEVFF